MVWTGGEILIGGGKTACDAVAVSMTAGGSRTVIPAVVVSSEHVLYVSSRPLLVVAIHVVSAAPGRCVSLGTPAVRSVGMAAASAEHDSDCVAFGMSVIGVVPVTAYRVVHGSAVSSASCLTVRCVLMSSCVAMAPSSVGSVGVMSVVAGGVRATYVGGTSLCLDVRVTAALRTTGDHVGSSVSGVSSADSSCWAGCWVGSIEGGADPVPGASLSVFLCWYCPVVKSVMSSSSMSSASVVVRVTFGHLLAAPVTPSVVTA